MPQLHHGQVPLVSGLATSLAGGLRSTSGFPMASIYSLRQFRPSLHLQLLDLTLDRLGQTPHEVIPVDLHRQSRLLARPRIETTSVTSDHFHSRIQPNHSAKLAADRTGSRSTTRRSSKSMSMVPYRCYFRQAQSSTPSVVFRFEVLPNFWCTLNPCEDP
jgi:hypothetical protein